MWITRNYLKDESSGKIRRAFSLSLLHETQNSLRQGMYRGKRGVLRKRRHELWLAFPAMRILTVSALDVELR